MIAGITFGQTRFGILAGPNFSSATVKNSVLNSGKETGDLVVGVRAGFTADLATGRWILIGTGLLLQVKVLKTKTDNDLKTTLSYIQLPINFLFKPEVGSGWLNLGAGPYVAYGIGGKHKGTIGNLAAEFDAFDDESGIMKLKRFDAGLGVVCRLRNESRFVHGYQCWPSGLVNAFDNTDNDRSWKNTSFGVSLGYKF